MIAISSLTFDPDGHLVLRELPDSELNDATRRVNRARTLDGGVAINDNGYSHGDRTFRVRWIGDAAPAHRLLRLYGRLRVVTREGVFQAVPESIGRRGKTHELSLLVVERET